MDAQIGFKPLNYWGDEFWSRHLMVLGFLKHFMNSLIDFLQDRMRSPELSMFIAGNYILNLNTQLYGIYTAYAICSPTYPDSLSVPKFLMLDNVFSQYFHHFYFLVFIGNLARAPFIIVLISASYCVYDFILVLVDALFCRNSGADFSDNPAVLIYSVFRTILTAFIVAYWVAILLLSRKNARDLSFGYYIILPFQYILGMLIKVKCLKKFKEFYETPFEYPIRIKVAGVIAAIFCLLASALVIFKQLTIIVYKVYEIIDALYSTLHYLDSLEDSEIIAILSLQSTYFITAETIKSIVRLLINLLVPIWPCTVTATICGLLVALLSVFYLFYSYKKIILKIISEGEESPYLKEIWKFRSHNSIFFCPQFIVNCVFLQSLFGFTIFWVAYILSFKETEIWAFNFVKSRPTSFWISLIPVFIGSCYFRTLVDKNNFVKNKVYFSCWDTWYFLTGTLGSVIKAAVRYLIGLGSIILLGFRADSSIIPSPLDKLDTLYCGFYGCIIMHCLKEGIIPREIINEHNLKTALTNPIN